MVRVPGEVVETLTPPWENFSREPGYSPLSTHSKQTSVLEEKNEVDLEKVYTFPYPFFTPLPPSCLSPFN